eukprot:10154373-Heterocapsa_arctica.AAC.1
MGAVLRGRPGLESASFRQIVLNAILNRVEGEPKPRRCRQRRRVREFSWENLLLRLSVGHALGVDGSGR